jgi:hypothetical protein
MPYLTPSVNNNGEFSLDNDNIYYQTAQDQKPLTKDEIRRKNHNAGIYESLKKLENKIIVTKQDDDGNNYNIKLLDWKAENNRYEHFIRGNDVGQRTEPILKIRQYVINNLQSILEKSELSGIKDNLKKSEKPDVDKYFYFKANVNGYEVVFDLELKKSVSSKNVTGVQNPQLVTEQRDVARQTRPDGTTKNINNQELFLYLYNPITFETKSI